MTSFKKIAVAAAAALACSASMAVTVKLTDFAQTPAKNLKTVDGPGFNGNAGQYKGTINFGSGAESFLTFCTEITQNISFGHTYDNYSVVAGSTAWGAQKAEDLGKLFTVVDALDLPWDGATSAVIQAAVWEIVYEDEGNSYNFFKGDFELYSKDGWTNTLLAAANTQWGSLDAVESIYKVDQLYSKSAQNLLVISTLPVPEPESYAMLLAGLGAVGFIARRRRQD